MASTTKRRFTDEFKLEAVALWERSGWMQTEVAAELGIMPTMLRRWQRRLQERANKTGSTSLSPKLPFGNGKTGMIALNEWLPAGTQIAHPSVRVWVIRPQERWFGESGQRG